ncbi:MAG: DUF2760 domain-containing protein [Pedosphaera sp.]|nr:DUF2760 domain-containing protein [Pedosphaera sp.]
MQNHNSSEPGFFARLPIAFACFGRALADAAFARQVASLLAGAGAASVAKADPIAPTELPAERTHAAALALLAMLQREGSFVDFLQDDIASYPDADVGGAERVVHSGCRKVLSQCLALEPAIKDGEGARVRVPAEFDTCRIRLTSNVTGQPPFHGTLKHHGWIATTIRFPVVAANMDPRVLAPAEVEL